MRRAYGGSRCGDCVKTRCDSNAQSSLQRSQPKSKDPSGFLGRGGQDRQESYQVSAKGWQEIKIPHHPHPPSFTNLVDVACTRFWWQKTTNDKYRQCIQRAMCEMLSTPLLYTLLPLALHPLPKHFLFHLLPPKCLRSPISTL